MSTRLDLEAFEASARDFDAVVEAEPGIDQFCSGSAWILPFHRAFVPDRELQIYRSEGAFVALATREDPQIGVYLEPLETMWQFACPLAGPGCSDLLAEVQERIAADLGRQNLPMVLSGVPMSGELAPAIASALDGSHQLRVVHVTVRFVASLEGGFDGWLGRRRASMRRNLRAAVRAGERAGLAFEHVRVGGVDVAENLYPRILAVERKSWKSRQGEGVDAGPMRAFYGDMLPRLAEQQRLHVLFAKLGEEDVGYLHGGAAGRSFRGLQLSFDADLERLSIGNLLQHEMIRALCDEDFLTYDTGSNNDYKERWTERGLDTATVVCRPVR